MLPCKTCLIIPLCRNRSIDKIFKECSLLVKWFDPSSNDPDLIAEKVSTFVMWMRPQLIDEKERNDE